MKIDMEVICSVIIAIFASSGFWNYIQSKKDKNNVKIEAILALLHDKLYYLCNKHLKDDYITVEELENIDCLYKPYKEMGGNGTIEILYEKIKKLPQYAEKENKKI